MQQDIQSLKAQLKNSEIHYVYISDAIDFDSLKTQCEKYPYAYTNVERIKQPNPLKASNCHEYTNRPYYYDVAPVSDKANHIDMKIDIKVDRPITLVLNNSNYVNWKISGNTKQIKAIFLINNTVATLENETNTKIPHIYGLHLAQNVCPQ